MTVGRFPNSEGWKDQLGLEMSGRQILVDKQLKTSVAGVYAIGDVASGIMLAHKATHDGEICAEVIAGHDAYNDARTVPAVVFTDPEIATAGLQEQEAKDAGYDIKVGKFPWGANARAVTHLDTDGFIKVILDKADDRVLGVTICGPHASDLISRRPWPWRWTQRHSTSVYHPPAPDAGRGRDGGCQGGPRRGRAHRQPLSSVAGPTGPVPSSDAPTVRSVGAFLVEGAATWLGFASAAAFDLGQARTTSS